jgi:hypothetical protein
MSLMKETASNASIRVTDCVWSILQEHRVVFRKLDREKLRVVVLHKDVVVEQYTTVSTPRLQMNGCR